MTAKKYIGAIDQGTTSTRFVIFDKKGKICAMHQMEHKQIYPEPGLVEHDPLEIKNNTFTVIEKTLKSSNIKCSELAGIGITNQRETTLIWDPVTGQPYCNAIVWQDTRTDDICKNSAINGDKDCFRNITGLPLATYFSGPKIKWILENIPGIKKAILNNRVLFGTIDSWIVWWLTGGPGKGIHVTDVTNASRTMLMNLETLEWDKNMLEVFDIPEKILPKIASSSEIYGYTNKTSFIDTEIPIAGILGDQQAALFGQVCFNKGDAKNTYGTGSFFLLNTGDNVVHSRYGLITTCAYKIGKNTAAYALEGSVAITGSLVQWFRDNIGLIKESKEIEELAAQVKDSGGIYFVPAFTGLFAPYWKSDARGLIIGLTHYINKSHIARAILEAAGYQIAEIYDAMKSDTGIKFTSLKVDGGMVVNNILMQFQADILGIPVIRPHIIETTVLGAAYSAGLAVGFWENMDILKKNWQKDRQWIPQMDQNKKDKLYNGWKKAVERTFNWCE